MEHFEQGERVHVPQLHGAGLEDHNEVAPAHGGRGQWEGSVGGVAVGGVYGGDSDGKETVRKKAYVTGMGRWQWERRCGEYREGNNNDR